MYANSIKDYQKCWVKHLQHTTAHSWNLVHQIKFNMNMESNHVNISIKISETIEFSEAY